MGVFAGLTSLFTPAGAGQAAGQAIGTVVQGLIEEFHLPPEKAEQYRQALLQATLSDVQSARSMQAANPSFVPGLLTVLITCGYFTMLGYTIHYGLPHVVGQAGGEALFMLIQTLATGFGMMLQFWFGSSMSSQQKDNYLWKSTPIADGQK